MMRQPVEGLHELDHIIVFRQFGAFLLVARLTRKNDVFTCATLPVANDRDWYEMVAG